ncbi:ABC transporter permease [Auraticoccus monumenti]|uniref:Putative ABC transport system permease protein n=1 Tax=Auraticoccus monumenti TaxID=675864 RepID=A0A1G6Z7S4_9ACTN|nr:ABC transporter permease [Auraticoccus monumenti]SDD98037.1 putative ABC transport system permease protein [Auraticoccus monumenti]
MNTATLVATAVANSLRSASRTALTSAAIVIGAFTLTLTTGVGAGINSYIDTTVDAFGAEDVLTVTHSPEGGDGPQRYDAETTLTTNEAAGPPGSSNTVEAVTEDDLRELRDVEGVLTAEPTLALSADYISHDDGRPYLLQVTGLTTGTTLQLLAGEQLDNDSSTRQVALPESYLDPLDLDDAEAAIDEEVTVAVTDADGEQTTLTATITAVTEPGLGGTEAATANTALAEALYDRQSVGVSDEEKESYPSATVTFDTASTETEVIDLKDQLADLGYDAQTVDDQIGDFTTVIDTVVLILNGFAVIALLAAGLGIVNTLLMSVQERTREIGLMKAMGLGSGRIFSLFSIEAAFIGLIGSVVGVGLAVVVGTIANVVLTGGALADLPGLTLLVFSPASIGGIILLILAIALAAGAIPALRAARQDPIESLRYE